MRLLPQLSLRGPVNVLNITLPAERKADDVKNADVVLRYAVVYYTIIVYM
jgi:hypothetical protein